jgi:DNA repair protein RadC
MTLTETTMSSASQCIIKVEESITARRLAIIYHGLFDTDAESSGLDDVSCHAPQKRTAENNVDLCAIAGKGEVAKETYIRGEDPHTTSHGKTTWQGLCSQLLSANEEAVPDEDLLALLLSYLNAGVNPRNLATQLITRFETFGSVISARSTQIAGVASIGPEIVNFLKVVRAAGARLAREEISNRPILDAWDKLVSYLRAAMAHQSVEQFRVLFLDRRNVLIADELQHRGTIDHTPVYPREVAKRALELDASAIIMVHNHPSNHPVPSKADVEMTKLVRETLERLGIVLHDHIIISRRGHTSFRAMGLLD